MHKYEPLGSPFSLMPVCPSPCVTSAIYLGKQCQPFFPPQPQKQWLSITSQQQIRILKVIWVEKAWDVWASEKFADVEQSALSLPAACLWHVEREREVGGTNLDHLPEDSTTLWVPCVPQLIPLYPGEAGCQICEGGVWGAEGDKSRTNTYVWIHFNGCLTSPGSGSKERGHTSTSKAPWRGFRADSHRIS